MKKYGIVTLILLLNLLLISCQQKNSQVNPPVIPPDTSTSVNYSNSSFKTTHFSGSQICADCHNGITGTGDVDVSLELDWASTMMANSARDPLFRAKVASETLRNPSIKTEIEQKCSRCHTPMANIEAKLSGQPVALLPPGFLSPEHEYFDAAMDGISCTLCHQIENDEDFGEKISFSGNFSINLDRIIYGPFATPVASTMVSATGYNPELSSHISTSEICSSCHNLFTDIVDATTDQLTGEKFPEQTTYEEWEQSSFAQAGSGAEKSCQDCHMPEISGVKVANRGTGLSIQNKFSRHYLVGANTFMLDILNNNKSLLGIKANNFEKAIERTRDLLQSSASISVKNPSNIAGTINFTVNVNNLTGHKLPSGYPARRAYLHVTITDADNTNVFESGLMNANGSIVGVDDDTNSEKYEPHHNVITQSNQVQVYESIMQNTNNEVTYTLLNGASYKKDNRLLPEGFDKNIVSSDIAPDITTLADLNFIAASDDVIYRLELAGTAPYKVNVELNYQSVSYQYAQDLFKDLDKHEYINTFKQVYDTAKIQKETISAVNITIE